jgi:hypothetical protein
MGKPSEGRGTEVERRTKARLSVGSIGYKTAKRRGNKC